MFETDQAKYSWMFSLTIRPGNHANLELGEWKWSNGFHFQIWIQLFSQMNFVSHNYYYSKSSLGLSAPIICSPKDNEQGGHNISTILSNTCSRIRNKSFLSLAIRITLNLTVKKNAKQFLRRLSFSHKIEASTSFHEGPRSIFHANFQLWWLKIAKPKRAVLTAIIMTSNDSDQRML
jgi:hypothetical protein